MSDPIVTEVNKLADNAKEKHVEDIATTVSKSEVNVVNNTPNDTTNQVKDGEQLVETQIDTSISIEKKLKKAPVLDTTPEKLKNEIVKDEEVLIEQQLEKKELVKESELTEQQPEKESETESTGGYVPSENIKKYVHRLYLELGMLMEPLNVNSTNFILLVSKCMEKVEKLKAMENQEKKEVCLLVLKRLVNDLRTPDATKHSLLKNLPSLIETVILASKLNLKKGKKNATKLAYTHPKQVVDNIYQQVEDIVKKNKYSAQYITNNLSLVVSKVMTIVEQYKDMTDTEKKTVVLRTMERLSDNLTTLFPDMTSEMVETVLQTKTMLPAVVDMVVSVGGGQYDINLKKYRGWFSKCKFC